MVWFGRIVVSVYEVVERGGVLVKEEEGASWERENVGKRKCLAASEARAVRIGIVTRLIQPAHAVRGRSAKVACHLFMHPMGSWYGTTVALHCLYHHEVSSEVPILGLRFFLSARIFRVPGPSFSAWVASTRSCH